jgi:PAS domain S-box-containing protein
VSTFGNEVWIVAHFVPFTSRGERLLLLLADDVSEKMKASAALRASEEKYRVVVEALYEGMALVDRTGRFTFVNNRLSEMGGFAPGEMVGMHYSRFVPETDLPALVERQILARSVESETFEMPLLRKDGTLMDTRISVASVVDAQGAPTALAILVTDISIRKKAERDRERLVGELEQKNKELETLLYVASHDLRSPLVNIQGFSQRIAKSLGEIRKADEAAGSLEELRSAMAPHVEDRMPASLEFIRASGSKMDAIINGLLTLSRAGRMVLRAEALDMNALVQTCVAAQAFQLQSVEGTVQVEGLPSCKADPLQVAQIFSNLLDNAVKYRDPDRPLRVLVTGRPAGGSSVYCIEDNGVGIAPEHQDRVWEIFQRLDPMGPIQGNGLGLTLVRRMAERNGGRVRVESAPGAGCRFILELPAEVKPS